jgi:hypothetical protein
LNDILIVISAVMRYRSRLRPFHASAKVRTGDPIDDEEDYALAVWAGQVPIFAELLAGPEARALADAADCAVLLRAVADFKVNRFDGLRNAARDVHARFAAGHYGLYQVGVNAFHGEAAIRILKKCELGARVTAPGAAATTIRGCSTRSTW